MSWPVVCRPGGIPKSLNFLSAAAGQGNLAAAAEELVSPEPSLHIQDFDYFSHTHIDASTWLCSACKASHHPGSLSLPLMRV